MKSGCLTWLFCVRRLLIFEGGMPVLPVVYVIERYSSEDSSHNTLPWGLMTLHSAYDLVRLREAHKLPVYTRPHILRHACLTHIAAEMVRQGVPEKMIKAALKDLAGHVRDQTLEGYLHLAAPKSAVVRSPIEDL